MTMGTTGMRDMSRMGMPLPPNSIPMLGFLGQYGNTVFGGMGNILKVRENITDYSDPGLYQFPSGTQPRKATQKEIESLCSRL
ncbi:hypothetical protein N9Y92_03090 [Chlamydiales bacterium]|nr:hypothetical protein [Chlamydiales bacterium]